MGHITWREHLHQVVLHDVADDAVPAKRGDGARSEERSLHAITVCEGERRGRSCGVVTHSSKYPARPCTPIFSLKVIRTCSKPGEWEGEGEPL